MNDPQSFYDKVQFWMATVVQGAGVFIAVGNFLTAKDVNTYLMASAMIGGAALGDYGIDKIRGKK